MEGVPGFSFAICEKQALAKLKNKKPKSLCLDLYAQAEGLKDCGVTSAGQFRFTPPTHSILAYHTAILEWEDEGGWKGRGGRYEENYKVLEKGIKQMGLEFYVKDPIARGYIITTILSPVSEPNWDFEFLYKFLADRGFVIYPGKLAKAESFRIGTIGKVYPADVENLMLVLKEAFSQMGISLPLSGN